MAFISINTVMLIAIAALFAAFIYENLAGLLRGGKYEFHKLVRSIVILGFLLAFATIGQEFINKNFQQFIVGSIISTLSDRIAIYECTANVFFGLGFVLLIAGAGVSTIAWIAKVLAKLRLYAYSSTIGEALLSLGRTMLWFFVFMIIEVGATYIATLFGLLVVFRIFLDPSIWLAIAMLGLAISIFPPLRGFGASLFASTLVAAVLVPLMAHLAEATLNIIAQAGVEGVVANTYNELLIKYASTKLGISVPPSGECMSLLDLIKSGTSSAIPIFTNLLTRPGFFYIDMLKFTVLTFGIPSFMYGFYLSLATVAAISVARYVAGEEQVTEAISGLLVFVRR